MCCNFRENKKLIELSKPMNTLIIYFSDHNFCKKKKKNFYDCSWRHSCNVNDQALIEILKEIYRGCTIILIIDACFGGGLFKIVVELEYKNQVADIAVLYLLTLMEFINVNYHKINDHMISKLQLQSIGSGCL